MQGLEDQAQRELQSLLERLHSPTSSSSSDILEIKHSSRDRLVQGVLEALITDSAPRRRLHTLVFRSGLSVTSLRRLQTALNHHATTSPLSNVHTLVFVSLRTEEEVALALRAATCGASTAHGGNGNGGIQRVRLANYRPDTARLSREDRESLARTLRRGISGDGDDDDDDDAPPPHGVTCVELVGYPLGGVGVQTLAPAVITHRVLTVLRLMDCDLRTDAIHHVADMVRNARRLRTLDLSYNRYLIVTASPLTREMFVKTLIRKGLKYNDSLHYLIMRSGNHDDDDDDDRCRCPAAVNRLLSANRFCHDFQHHRRDAFAIPPGVWPHALARVTAKPSSLYRFLRQTSTALFGS